MTLCDKCVLKNDCKTADFFGEGKLPLAHCKQHIPVPFGQQEEATEVMTGVTEETYEQAIHMFDNEKERKTNFDRITASPEALAEWLNEHSDYCREIQNWQCDKCPYGDKDCPIENTWLDWLNEESKE